MVGVLLGIAALLAAGVAGYAIWSLTQTPASVAPAPDSEGNANPATGIAQTESIEEILGAVQVYVRNQQFAQALTVLEKSVAQYPSDQELRLSLGDLYMMRQRYNEAYDQYLAAIEIGPSTAKAEFTAGTLANMLDRPELAEAHYSAAMRLDPSNPDIPVYLAAIQMKTNHLDEAKVNLALAGKMAPDSARIYAMRSEIALRQNKPTIALEQIRKARGIEPRALGWVLQEARVLKRQGDAQGAVDLLTALPQEQLEDPETAYQLAECYGMLGKPDEAASRLIDVADKHPTDPKLVFEVALWLERAGKREQALDWAGRAKMLGNARAGDWIASLP